MIWENYFDSNIAFTVILQINAASGVRNSSAVPIPSPYKNFALYDELQKQ